MSISFKCKPRQARKFILDCIEAGLVPYLKSSPGMGKSSIVHSIAREYQLGMIDHRLSTSEPTDMTGLPRFTPEGHAVFAPFVELFPIAGTPVPNGKQGWMVFLDEFSSAPRQVQAAAYKLVLDRMVGQHKLHEKVCLVAAGNLSSDRAIVNPLSTAMQSRVVHLEMEIDFNEWLEDVAIQEGYDRRIIAFLMQFPSKLMDFRPEHQEHTFCCPRTWEFVNRLISGVDEAGNQVQKPVTDETAVLLTGAITSGVALEFVQFTKVYTRLISIDEILRDPEGCRLPDSQDLKWALLTHLMDKVTHTNFSALSKYIDRFDLPFRILYYRFLLVRQPTLRDHPDFGPAAARVLRYLHS